MRKIRRCYERREGNGFAGLALVLVLAGMMMCLFLVVHFGAGNPFAPWEGTAADRYADANAMAWEEGHLFIDKKMDAYGMGGRRPPFRGQPKLGKMFRWETALYLDGEDMGIVRLTVKENGDAISRWKGDFWMDGRHYEAVEGVESWSGKYNIFFGNTAPLKAYIDQDGIDKSKLYVITQGEFLLQGTKENDAIEGIVYLTAWISKDYTAEGVLALPYFDGAEAVICEWGPVKLSSD